MNCEQFSNVVHDLTREETLDSATIDAALTHAEICGACDTLLERVEALSNDMRSLSEKYSCEEASPHVEKALLAKLFQQAGEHSRAQPKPHSAEASIQKQFAAVSRAQRGLRGLRYTRPIPGFWLAGLAGVAATAIFFVSLTVKQEVPAPISPSQTEVVAAADKANETGIAGPNDWNSADSFVPLSSTFDSSSLDDDAVVRVVLSDSALESLGLQASEVGRGQVVADLAVASDGIPQAIRVVGW